MSSKIRDYNKLAVDILNELHLLEQLFLSKFLAQMKLNKVMQTLKMRHLTLKTIHLKL